MKHPEKLKGMMGPLVRNEIDITGKYSTFFVSFETDQCESYTRWTFLGTVLFLTEDRLAHIEYLSVTLAVSIAFIFRAPPLSYVSNIYYLPFNAVVWICAICLVLVCTALISIVFKFSKENNSNLTNSDFVMYGITTVCQMGSQMTPKTAAGRIATVLTSLILHRFPSSFIFQFSTL